MEDINNWETKYVNCKYSERLVNKLSELNQQVTIPVNMDKVKKVSIMPKNIMAAKCDNPAIHITPIQ